MLYNLRTLIVSARLFKEDICPMNQHFKFYVVFVIAFVTWLPMVGSQREFLILGRLYCASDYECIQQALQIAGGIPVLSIKNENYQLIYPKTNDQTGMHHSERKKISRGMMAIIVKNVIYKADSNTSFYFPVKPYNLDISNLLKAIALVSHGSLTQKDLKFVGFGAESARQEKMECLVRSLMNIMPVFDLATSEVSADDIIARFDQEFWRLNFPHAGSLDDLSGALQALQTIRYDFGPCDQACDEDLSKQLSLSKNSN